MKDTDSGVLQFKKTEKQQQFNPKNMEQYAELIDQDFSYVIGCWLNQGWLVKCMCPAGINGSVLVVFERQSRVKNG